MEGEHTLLKLGAESFFCKWIGGHRRGYDGHMLGSIASIVYRYTNREMNCKGVDLTYLYMFYTRLEI